MRSFKIIIPARFQSTRFPGKLLAKIDGISILKRVYQRAVESKADQVIIATDDKRIEKHVREMGAEVFFSKTIHRSGTERIIEVAKKKAWINDEIIINLQADEPFINPSHINQLFLFSLKRNSQMATLASMANSADLSDNNCVKLVLNYRDQALYFSRAKIPSLRIDHLNNSKQIQLHSKNIYRHIGVYAFKADFLQTLVSYPVCDIETIESLEQLRALYYGHSIDVLIVKANHIERGVDNENQIKKIEAKLKKK